MKRSSLSWAAMSSAILVLSIPLAAQADMINVLVELSGQAERPTPVDTNGTGAAGLLLDTDTGLFSWAISFEELTAPLTAAHFHAPAGVDDTAEIVLGLLNPAAPGIPTIDNIAADGLSGLFLGSATLNDDDVQDLLGGLWYINIHSEFAPGGELRGQIFQAVAAPIPTPTPVPEPATLALLALGLAGLGFARRRRG